MNIHAAGVRVAARQLPQKPASGVDETRISFPFLDWVALAKRRRRERRLWQNARRGSARVALAPPAADVGELIGDRFAGAEGRPATLVKSTFDS
jgi:hypothetical protein